jgi:hypothetical protein
VTIIEKTVEAERTDLHRDPISESAVREAWHSVERVLPGDADRDGR